MPRYSQDPKGHVIKVRVNEDMRKHLERKAERDGVSLSEYFRRLVENDIQQSDGGR